MTLYNLFDKGLTNKIVFNRAIISYGILLESNKSNKCFTVQPVLWGNSYNTWEKYVMKRKKKCRNNIISN